MVCLGPNSLQTLKLPPRAAVATGAVQEPDSGPKRCRVGAIILRDMRKNGARPVIEIGFIVFLFYSNLLMGEFERSGMGTRRGFLWALSDIFTIPNLAIAAVAAAIGYVLVEFLRTRS